MEDTKPEDIQLVGILPFWTVPRDCRDEHKHAVRLYRAYGNPCEHRGQDGACDESGCYYGHDGSYPPGAEKYCPRHWYRQHEACGGTAHLVDMTAEEHREQAKLAQQEKARRTSLIANQLNDLANGLRSDGFLEGADRIYLTSGYIRASGRSH